MDKPPQCIDNFVNIVLSVKLCHKVKMYLVVHEVCLKKKVAVLSDNDLFLAFNVEL